MEQVFILKEPINKIEHGSDLFKKIIKLKVNYNQENFIIFYLNTKNQVIKSEILFKGGIDSCLICPKTMFRNCLLIGGSKIIIAHNHPSKDLNPSYEDKEVFDMLKNAGEIITIPILDFVIFNKKQFYSLNHIK